MRECKLCQAIKNELPLYEDKNFVILHTKNMKGHHKRIMIVYKKHLKRIPDEKACLRKFKEFCYGYFNEEPTYALVEGTYASIPNHWHKIACDWFGKEDDKQLKYTPHSALQTKVKWEPKR